MRRNAGFTLVEVMVVVVIISMLAAMGAFVYINQQKKANIEMSKTTIAQTEEALSLFKLHNKKYPESLSQLVPEYVKHVPMDAWGNPLQYIRDPQSKVGYRLGSYGADNTAGGDDENADLWNISQ